MTELKISENIIIDEPENVTRAIYNLSGKKAELMTICKFIQNEKNTRYYLDKKLNSSTEAGKYTDYLWLDTGYTDQYEKPIMVCLHHEMNCYVGHYTANIRSLANRVGAFNQKNKKDIETNYSRFVAKYEKRLEERTHAHINDELNYLVDHANKDEWQGQTAFAMALSGLSIEFAPEEAQCIEAPAQEEDAELQFSKFEEEITMDLLWDIIDQRKEYIDQLLAQLNEEKKNSEEGRRQMAELEAKNMAYKKAFADMRTYMGEEVARANACDEADTLAGHNLLGRNGKILVLGNTDIRVAEMRAIARDMYGFEKADFEFETDYDKVKNAGRRIHNTDRYAAVIFGNCPHKVAGIGNWSSIIEEFTQNEECPFAIDARTKAGGLKITKESYREALRQIYSHLREAC